MLDARPAHLLSGWVLSAAASHPVPPVDQSGGQVELMLRWHELRDV